MRCTMRDLMPDIAFMLALMLFAISPFLAMIIKIIFILK